MEARCPDCGAVLPAAPAECPSCRLPLTGPAATELWNVDQRIAVLMARRLSLLAILRTARDTGRPATAVGAAPRAAAEVTRLGVRNILLILGGLLIGIAAIAFTVISWGELGMGARALILLSLTGIALGVAWPLSRRHLDATAETIAAVGLLLIFLQAYAAYAYDLFGVTAIGGRWYAAVSVTVITMIWAGYGAAAPLRLPRPTVVVLAQVPLPLFADAMGVSPAGGAVALLLTCGLDLAIVRAEARRAAVRQGEERDRSASASASATAVPAVATALGLLTGLCGTALALLTSFEPERPLPYALPYTGALLVATVVALAWALLYDRAAAAVAGLTAAVALATPIPLSLTWRPVAYAGAAVAVLAAVRFLSARPPARLPRLPRPAVLPLPVVRDLPPSSLRLRTALSAGAAVPLAMAALWVLPDALSSVAGQVGLSERSWGGLPDPQAIELAVYVPAGVPVVLGLLAATLIVMAGRHRGWAAPPVAMAALTVPAAAGFPYGITLVLMLATAGALACWAGLDDRARTVAGLTAAAVTVPTALASLATEAATLWVLGTLSVLAAGIAVAARPLRAGAATVAVLALGGFTAAAGLSAGLPARWAAFGVLAVSALAAVVAAVRVRSVILEAAGWLVAAAAVAMTADWDVTLSLSLALTGVIALGVALRADRRRSAWAGSALLIVAFWIRLGVLGVTAPEAYTAPVSAGLLLVGVLRRRRDPATSSWLWCAPALATTFVPSLLLALNDAAGTPRPLLLGAAALVVALWGARHRQQAPLLLGGAVTFLDAAHAVAPTVAAIAARVPGWVPVALAGAIVLAIGATYEQRLRDFRRLRDTVSHMG